MLLSPIASQWRSASGPLLCGHDGSAAEADIVLPRGDDMSTWPRPAAPRSWQVPLEIRPPDGLTSHLPP